MEWTAPRTTWTVGALILVLGVLYGIYWGATREGLAALGGIVIVMVSIAAATLVTTGATIWAAASRNAVGLPRGMVVGTGITGLVALGLVLSMVVGGAGPLVWMSLLAILGIAAMMATAWAWNVSGV